MSAIETQVHRLYHERRRLACLSIRKTGFLLRVRATTTIITIAMKKREATSNAESWWARIEKLNKGRLLGRFFAASRARLREAAAHLGVHHLANRAGCPAR